MLMNHKQRLDAIERQFGETIRRCVECEGWPPTRILWPEDGVWQPSDPTPERCSNCGWEPVTIKVAYTDAVRAAYVADLP